MVEERGAVRHFRRGGICRTSFALLAVGVALALAGPATASADDPPSLAPSTIGCTDANGGGLRPGDALNCSLIAWLAGGTENATVSGSVQLPDSVNIDPTQPPPSYDATTRKITYGPLDLGFTFSGQQRIIGIHLLLADDVPVATDISLSADLKAVGELDGATATKTVTSATVTVSPPPAVLDDSSVACTDVNGGTLLPGELVACQLDVTNASGHEDAGSVQGRIALPSGTWVSGGASLGPITAVFDTSELGLISSGATKSVSATFQLLPTLLGGALVSALASATGTSTPSGIGVTVSPSSPPLVVAPGPAHLAPLSSLICSDTNGGILLPGDDLGCSVTVAPAAGYEEVQGATATVQIPAHAQYVSGGDSHDASSVSFDTPSLGDVAAGATKTATFHMSIQNGTAPQTVLAPSGSIAATSVPLGGAVQQALIGNFLTVGQLVVQPGETPPDAPLTVVTPPPVTPPVVVASKAYKLKANTIRFVMRSAHRRGNHVWKGSKRRFAFVKKFVVRTPKISGKVVKRVTVPKKGKWAPQHGVVKIKGTRLRYTLKKGVNPGTVKDRFHYTVTDTRGKKVTGTVVISHQKS